MIVPTFDSFTTGEKVTAAKLNKNVRDGGNFFRSPPTAFLRQAAAFNVASGTADILVTLDTVAIDNDGMADIANSAIKVVTPGLYLINARLSLASNTTGYRIASIYQNSSLIGRAHAAPATGANTVVNTWAYARAVAGDSFTLQAIQNSGATLATGAGAAGTALSALWIGT